MLGFFALAPVILPVFPALTRSSAGSSSSCPPLGPPRGTGAHPGPRQERWSGTCQPECSLGVCLPTRPVLGGKGVSPADS